MSGEEKREAPAAAAGGEKETGASRDAVPESYTALALQVACRAVHEARDGAEARALMMADLDRLESQIRASKAFIGSDCRLVVLPEYFMTGFPMGDTIAGWAAKACIRMDGPEYERMGEICRRAAIYLAGNAYELDPAFPGLYFQTSFILDDRGEVVLRYRRLNSMFAPTPHDVWQRYLEVYGYEAVFPVAHTPLGRLAAIASEEILYPEVARCLAMRGAEVFVHSTSESAGSGDTPKDVAKRARAFENCAFVVSANSAGILNTPIPAASADGGSKVVDFMGRVLAAASPGESMAAHATVDLHALRRWRRRPGMMNMLARQRFELYARSYGGARFYPPDTMLGGPVERSHFLQQQLATIRRLEESGII